MSADSCSPIGGSLLADADTSNKTFGHLVNIRVDHLVPSAVHVCGEQKPTHLLKSIAACWLDTFWRARGLGPLVFLVYGLYKVCGKVFSEDWKFSNFPYTYPPHTNWKQRKLESHNLFWYLFSSADIMIFVTLLLCQLRPFRIYG